MSSASISVSKTSDLRDGDVVNVRITGFTPGGVDDQHPTAKLVISGGPQFDTIPDKINFDEYSVATQLTIQPDGTATGQYTLTIDHGTVQDGTRLNCALDPCWLVAVQEPFLPTPKYASTPLTFAPGQEPTEPTSSPGSSISVSKTNDLRDGDVVNVRITGFTPGGVDGQHPTAKLVISGGPRFDTIPDKINFDEYSVATQLIIQPDGTATGQYTVTIDHGTVQDGTRLNCSLAPCWLVAVQEPFLPSPKYASTPLTFVQ